MARPKNITIDLTTTQRSQLRSLTGEDHKQIYFEVAKTAGRKAPVARRMAPRSVGKGIKVLKGKGIEVGTGSSLPPSGGGLGVDISFDPSTD